MLVGSLIGLSFLIQIGLNAPDPPEFDKIDCGTRQIVYEKAPIPSVYDALRIQECGGEMKPPVVTEYRPTPLHAQTQIWVDPSKGSDSNPGTQTAPLKTLQAVLDKSLQSRSSADQPLSVMLLPGNYRLSKPLELDERHSNIAWQSVMGPTETFISSLSSLSLKWDKWNQNPNIYQASVPKNTAFNSLFVNGVRQVRARYPNGNPADVSGMCFSKTNFPRVESCNWMKIVKSGPAMESGTVHSISFPNAHQASGQDRHWNIVEPPSNVKHIFPGNVTTAWASPFARPSSFTVNETSPFSKIKTPGKVVVHALHGSLWGGWQFLVSNISQTNNSTTFNFQYGGWQEARGASSGSHMYVENDIALLDSPGEWYLDEEQSQLYYYPNATDDISTLSFEAPSLLNLLTITGKSQTAKSIRFEGIQFLGTSTAFLDRYWVGTSGGDWSLSEYAAIDVTNTENFMMAHCKLHQLGSNGIILRNHVINSVVTHSEFYNLGASAIVSLGSTNFTDGSDRTYPDSNTFSFNVCHDIGVYGKQTSCYFQALTANTSLLNNVFFNGPRAGVNFNDGFGGGTVMKGNVIFNFVRETGDHGPFNSWDRRPYQNWVNGKLSWFPAENIIKENVIIVGYNSVWTVDNDDGSAFYTISNNTLIYGGCKNFLGNNKTCGPDNFILFPGITSRESGDRRCQTDDNNVFADQYYWGNECYVTDAKVYSQKARSCPDLPQEFFHTWGNVFYTPDASFEAFCEGKTLNFTQWQGYGFDRQSKMEKLPDSKTILDRLRQKVLGNFL